ncbi:hypothetical protein GMMP15_2160001 [Candidatus Magnetomoraceae bacterium gMMP-15]
MSSFGPFPCHFSKCMVKITENFLAVPTEEFDIPKRFIIVDIASILHLPSNLKDNM